MRTACVSRSLAGAVLVALLLSLFPASSAAARDDERYRLPEARAGATLAAADKGGIVQREAVLTPADRAAGFPTRDEAYLRLTEARVSIYLDEGIAFAEAYVEGEPPIGVSPTAFFDVGTLRDGTCEISFSGLSDTFPSNYTNEREEFPDPGWAEADCAVVTVREPDEGLVTDAFVARLRDVTPMLSVRAPTLLGSRKLGLVRGVWTQVQVPVANAGPIAADRVDVRGAGKGLMVRPGRITFPIAPDAAGSATVRVKVVGKQRRSRLTLTASGAGAQARRTVVVRSVKAPPRPRSGRYVDPAGDVSFTVRKSTVRGFRVFTQTFCGGTSSSNDTYTFPTTKIPRNGIVDQVERRELFSVSLQLKIAGGKVTRGRFSYSGPAGCRAFESFTATRR